MTSVSSRPDPKSSLDRLRAEVERRNPAEPEFHQAAREVLEPFGERAAPLVAAARFIAERRR